MKINEIFKAIQGEGLYQGFPVLFVRTSGCTRKCSFCDTKYHLRGKEMTSAALVKKINSEHTSIVVFTGGEPLLYLTDIIHTIINSNEIKFHLETNGDLIKNYFDLKTVMNAFDHISISPKSLEVARRISVLADNVHLPTYKCSLDIKVVTNLRTVGIEMTPFATTLMPLTTHNKKEDAKIRRKVWNYCLKYNLHFSARLHELICGGKRGS